MRPPAAVSATLIVSFLVRRRVATASAAVLRTAGGNDIAKMNSAGRWESVWTLQDYYLQFKKSIDLFSILNNRETSRQISSALFIVGDLEKYIPPSSSLRVVIVDVHEQSPPKPRRTPIALSTQQS